MRDCTGHERAGRKCLASMNATRDVFGMRRVQGVCTTCEQSPCAVPEACEVPLAELQPIDRRLFARRTFPRLPTTRDGWGRLIGATLGGAGGLFFLWAAARNLGVI